jgi:hypothetical protein
MNPNTEYSHPNSDQILVLCERCAEAAQDDEDDAWLVANGIRQATDDSCDRCGREAHR